MNARWELIFQVEHPFKPETNDCDENDRPDTVNELTEQLIDWGKERDEKWIELKKFNDLVDETIDRDTGRPLFNPSISWPPLSYRKWENVHHDLNQTDTIATRYKFKWANELKD